MLPVGTRQTRPPRHDARYLVQDLLVRASGTLEHLERVVSALHDVEAGPGAELLADRPEEVEVGESVATALKE